MTAHFYDGVCSLTAQGVILLFDTNCKRQQEKQAGIPTVKKIHRSSGKPQNDLNDLIATGHNEHNLQLLFIFNATPRVLPMSCQDTVQSENIRQDMEYL